MDFDEELEQLRERYRAMVEMAPEAIVVFDFEQDRFIEVNPAACRLFGLSREVLLATGPAERSPETQPGGASSRELSRHYLRRARDGDPVEFDWVHLDADDRPVPCRVQLTPIPGTDQVRGQLLDRRAQRATEDERDRLRRIVEATPDLVGMADADLRTVFLNPAGRRLLGLGGTSWRGLPIASWHLPASWESLRDEALPTALEEGIWRGQSELRGFSGRPVPVSQVLIAHRDADGELQYVSTIARDITDQVEAERLQHQLYRSQKLESLGILASGLAHDVNNLLMGIRGHAELIRLPDTPPPEAADRAEAILATVDSASALARDLLAYAGEAVAEVGPVDLTGLVERLLGSLLRTVVSKKAEVVPVLEPVSPIEADAAQIEQVIMNLVINASDALRGEPGTLELRVAEERLPPEETLYDYRAPGTLDDPLVVFGVQDTGCGIEPDRLERIFEPFFTTRDEGRGLGLAAVLGIVRAHSGAIALESTPGEGTRCRIGWPLSADRVATAPEDPTAGPRQWSGRALIADDEAGVLDVLEAFLDRLGFEVDKVADGSSAVAGFDEGRIDVLVLDWTMPGLSGREVLERVGGAVPAIVMSGYDLGEREGLPAEIPVLRKPFGLRDLERALARVL